ncbi:DUF317 domain-containing protein [Streptomyces coelicoflavus]|uniref:DUF317 domain-containing protein n=1 Tax=Streptomyces coelicoflavus TaxID=285562 RepID=UPI0036CA37AF
MLSHPLENLDPAQSVKVLPRHLAGPGLVDPRVVWDFPFEEGWPFAQTEAGTATAFSPCLRLHTTFDPQSDKPGRGTWTLNAHRAPFTPPAWRITFDATTPAEILHDVHNELLDLYLEDTSGDQEKLFQDATPPHEVYTPLLTHGWSHQIRTDGIQTFLSPEGLGGVRHRYAMRSSSEPAWRAWGGYPSEPHWSARFSFATPTTLVAAFTASLISTEPLQRTIQDVPTQTRRALYVATPTGKQQHGTMPVAPPPPSPAAGHTR